MWYISQQPKNLANGLYQSQIFVWKIERDWKAASFGLYMHTNVSFCLSDNVESPLENIDYTMAIQYSLQGSTKPAIPHFIIPSIIIFHISHARYLSINFEIATTYTTEQQKGEGKGLSTKDRNVLYRHKGSVCILKRQHNKILQEQIKCRYNFP